MAIISLRTLLFSLFAWASFVSASEEGPLQFLEDKYNALSNKGKFITTAAVGFVGTRVAVNTAMGAFKIGAAAFIAYVVVANLFALDLSPVLFSVPKCFITLE